MTENSKMAQWFRENSNLQQSLVFDFEKKKKARQLLDALRLLCIYGIFHWVVCIQVTYTMRLPAVTGQIKMLCNSVIIVLHLGKPSTGAFLYFLRSPGDAFVFMS